MDLEVRQFCHNAEWFYLFFCFCFWFFVFFYFMSTSLMMEKEEIMIVLHQEKQITEFYLHNETKLSRCDIHALLLKTFPFCCMGFNKVKLPSLHSPTSCDLYKQFMSFKRLAALSLLICCFESFSLPNPETTLSFFSEEFSLCRTSLLFTFCGAFFKT